MVENRGEFAVRGGILDVFPPTLARPVRVDFFGDEIESVSSFAVATSAPSRTSRTFPLRPLHAHPPPPRAHRPAFLLRTWFYYLVSSPGSALF